MASIDTEAVKCPNCGAVIDPTLPAGVTQCVLRCSYCDKKIRVRQEPPPAPAPGGGAGIVVNVPRIRVEIVKVRKVLYAVIAFAAGLPILIGLSIYLFASAGVDAVRQVTERIEGPAAAGGEAAAYPRRCGAGEELIIAGESLRHAGTIALATGDCKLDIRGANLTSSAVAVVARDQAIVTIDNSNVRGKGGALSADGKSRFTITNSTISSRGTAVVASGDAALSLSGTVLKGGNMAYKTEGMARVTLGKGCSVEGATSAGAGGEEPPAGEQEGLPDTP